MFAKDITIVFMKLMLLILGLKIFNMHFCQSYKEPDSNLEITGKSLFICTLCTLPILILLALP